MPRRTFQDARCLVTGASMGLGRALAEHLVRGGARVVLAARSADALDEVARALNASAARIDAALPVVADVTNADDRRRLLDTAADHFGGALDLAINNAGVGVYGRFESHDEAALRRIFEINFFALAEMTRGVLPLLRKGDSPALVNLGSIVARRGLPGRSEYSASKHAVAGFTEAIRAEWAIDGIHVMLVNPGFTATNFERNVLIDTALYKTQNRRTMPPDAVAAAALRALLRRKNEITFSPGGRTLLLIHRLLPRFVDWGLGRWTRRLYSDHLALDRAEGRSTPSPADHPVAPLGDRG
jgi:short-subunit dehydrogenase